MILGSTLLKRKLREGVSDQVISLAVPSVNLHEDFEVWIKLMFKRGSSIDQIIKDRDIIRNNFDRIVGSSSDISAFPFLHFEIDEESEVELPF